MSDVGVTSAIDKGVIPGPRLRVAPAVITPGSYAPRVRFVTTGGTVCKVP